MYIGSETIHVWTAFIPDILYKKDYAPSPVKGIARNKRNSSQKQCFKKNKVLIHRIVHAILNLYVSPSGEEYKNILCFKRKDGKPALRCNRLNFNVTHSFNHILVGIAIDSEIGIDIEKNKQNTTFERVVGRVFSTQEIEIYLSRKRICGRLLSFYQSWTRQESYFKALSSGMKLDWGKKKKANGSNSTSRWSIHSFYTENREYTFSVCTKNHIKRIRKYYFSPSYLHT